MSRRALPWGAVCLGGVLLRPGQAVAHLVSSGFGPAYDGILHFALSPDDIFTVVALALFAGLRGQCQARRLMFTLPAAWAVGGLLGMLFRLDPSPTSQQLETAAVFFAIGLLLAANVRLPSQVTVVGAALLGVVRGAAEGGTFAHGFGLEALLGIAAAVFVTAALAGSVTLPLKRLWMIVTIRVLGSWLATLGLLLMGWSIHANS